MAADNHGRSPAAAGLAALQAGRPQDAAAHLRAALAASPGDTDLMQLLGVALHKAGESDEGVALMARAIERNRRNPDYLINLANVHRDRREFAEAERLLRQAVVLAPQYAKGWQVLASALRVSEDLTESVKCRRRALALEPDSAAAMTRLGGALVDARRVRDGLAIYREVLARAPHHADARSSLVMGLHYLPDNGPAELLAEHRRAGEGLLMDQTPAPALGNAPEPGKVLRIGYVSPDFHQHSVAFFLAPVFAHHDPSQVEIVGYSDVGRPDATTGRLRARTTLWRDLHGRTDEAVAAMVREDGIDILVDLAGHTAGNRLGVFARKPAPVQVTWLGYPDTTGLPTIDARLTDDLADPPGAEAFATERLIRLADGFLCYGEPIGTPEVSPLPAGADRPITFGSFNNLPKLTNGVLDLWARLLAVVPDSRLLLKARGLGDAKIQQPIFEIFRSRGVAADRVRLVGRVPSYRDHMAIYGEMDVALDSFPYNGTTTTCEALWMGLPVVTLKGDRHCARVGESLLTRVGLTDLIAPTPDDYIAIAAGLAADRTRLAALRSGMRDRMRASPLMDAVGFTRRLEAVYRDLWRAWCARQAAG